MSEKQQSSGCRLTDRQKKFLIYGIFFLLILTHHLTWGVVSDDVTNTTAFGEMSMYDIFQYKYMGNGRIFTDMLAFVIYRSMPYWAWKVLDSLIWTGLAWLIARLFTDNETDQVLAVCMMLLVYPFGFLWSAGYIATTTNYIYPMLAMLLAVAPCIWDLRRHEKLPWYLYLLSGMGIIYADNQDQYAVALCGFLFLTVIYLSVCMKRMRGGTFSEGQGRMHCTDGEEEQRIRKCHKTAVIFFSVSASVYLLQWLMPGHIFRMHSTVEMDLYLPQYAQWSFLKKLYEGYSTTVGRVLFSQVDLMILLLILLFLTGLTSDSVKERVAGALPIAFHLLVKTVGYSSWIYVYNYAFGMPEIGPIRNHKDGMKHLAVLIVSILFILSIFMAVLILVRKSSERAAILILLVVGFGTRLMMGFSPTLYASRERTFTILLFAVLFSCVILYNNLRKNARTWSKTAALACIATVLVL